MSRREWICLLVTRRDQMLQLSRPLATNGPAEKMTLYGPTFRAPTLHDRTLRDRIIPLLGLGAQQEMDSRPQKMRPGGLVHQRIHRL